MPRERGRQEGETERRRETKNKGNIELLLHIKQELFWVVGGVVHIHPLHRSGVSEVS